MPLVVLATCGAGREWGGRGGHGGSGEDEAVIDGVTLVRSIHIECVCVCVHVCVCAYACELTQVGPITP